MNKIHKNDKPNGRAALSRGTTDDLQLLRSSWKRAAPFGKVEHGRMRDGLKIRIPGKIIHGLLAAVIGLAAGWMIAHADDRPAGGTEYVVLTDLVEGDAYFAAAQRMREYRSARMIRFPSGEQVAARAPLRKAQPCLLPLSSARKRLTSISRTMCWNWQSRWTMIRSRISPTGSSPARRPRMRWDWWNERSGPKVARRPPMACW